MASTAATITVERIYLDFLLERLRHYRLNGFNRAWHDWSDPAQLTPGDRAAVVEVADNLLATIDPATIPAAFDPEIFRIQAFATLRSLADHQAREAAKSKPPRSNKVKDEDRQEVATSVESVARTILEVPPPRREGPTGWALGGGNNSFKHPVSARWYAVSSGVIIDTPWRVQVAAWSSLTPEVRALFAAAAGDVPPTLTTPAATAWFTQVLAGPRTSNCDKIVAFRSLARPEVERWMLLALAQHEAWAAAGLLEGNSLDLRWVARDFLDWMARYQGGFPAELLERFARIGTGYTSDLFQPLKMSAKEPWFFDGFALVPIDEAATVSTAVQAGHAAACALDSLAEPLIVLLDLDLTDPSLAFLGLHGTRLRICDWGSEVGAPCFTRVTLDGGVVLVDEDGDETDDNNSHEIKPTDPLILGPAFASPLADMPELGWQPYSSRLGGPPSWEQEPEWPKTPGKRKRMTFLAQFPHPDGGTAYVFLDRVHLIAASLRQYD